MTILAESHAFYTDWDLTLIDFRQLGHIVSNQLPIVSFQARNLPCS